MWVARTNPLKSECCVKESYGKNIQSTSDIDSTKSFKTVDPTDQEKDGEDLTLAWSNRVAAEQARDQNKGLNHNHSWHKYTLMK